MSQMMGGGQRVYTQKGEGTGSGRGGSVLEDKTKP